MRDTGAGAEAWFNAISLLIASSIFVVVLGVLPTFTTLPWAI